MPFLLGDLDERAANHVSMPARPRRQLALVVVTLLGLLGVLVLADRGGSNTTAPVAAPALAPTTATRVSAPPTTTASTVPHAGFGGPTASRVLVSGSDGTTMLDLGSGLISKAPGFANGNVIPVSGGVVLGGPGALAYFAAPYDGEPRVLALFRNATVVPSAHTDRVWVVTSDPTTTAQEIASDGTVTVPPFELPPQTYPAGAVDGGLLVGLHGSMFVTQDGGDLRPLGPGEPLASSASTIAAVICDDRAQCPLMLIDVVSGARWPAPVNLGTADVRAAFSPDGSRLAVVASDRDSRRLTMIDVASGVTTWIASHGSQAGPASPAWSPSGDWIFWVSGSTVRATRSVDGVSREIWRTSAHIFAVYALEGS